MSGFESEAKLESKMIDQLRRQGYQLVEINDVKEFKLFYNNVGCTIAKISI